MICRRTVSVVGRTNGSSAISAIEIEDFRDTGDLLTRYRRCRNSGMRDNVATNSSSKTSAMSSFRFSTRDMSCSLVPSVKRTEICGKRFAARVNERAGQRRREHRCNTEGHNAFRKPCVRPDDARQELDPFQESQGLLIEKLARGGWLHTPCTTEEQSYSEARFEVCDLLAQGRLRNVQRRCRAREAAGINNAYKIA